jgi:hypothetical protein
MGYFCQWILLQNPLDPSASLSMRLQQMSMAMAVPALESLTGVATDSVCKTRSLWALFAMLLVTLKMHR